MKPKCWVLVTAKGQTRADACMIPFSAAATEAKRKIQELANNGEAVTVVVVENSPINTKTFETDGQGKVRSR